MPFCAKEGCKDHSPVGLQRYCDCFYNRDGEYKLYHADCLEDARVPPPLNEELIMSCMDESGRHILLDNTMLWRCPQCDFKYIVPYRRDAHGVCCGRMAAIAFSFGFFFLMACICYGVYLIQEEPSREKVDLANKIVIVSVIVLPLAILPLASKPYGCMPRSLCRRSYLDLTHEILTLTVKRNRAVPIIN